MPDPRPRVDGEYMKAIEREVTKAFLYRTADLINAVTRTGPIYSQILLPPEEAALKRQAMEVSNG